MKATVVKYTHWNDLIHFSIRDVSKEGRFKGDSGDWDT